jgi:hypothetical protein
VDLPALASVEVRALLADRFPTLEPVDPDIEAVRRQAEGSPGAIVGYLAQAYLRGDLRRETGRFSWDLAHLDTYRFERALSAEARRALDASTPAVRSTLEQLALLEAPVPQTLAATLCGATGIETLPESRLVSVSREGGQVRLALAGRAVRDAVLEGLGADRRDELRKGLLRALSRTPVPELAAEQARLLVDASDPERALSVLSQTRVVLAAPARARAQTVATRIATRHPTLLSSPTHRATLASTLLPGPDAKPLAAALVASFPAVFSAEDLRGVPRRRPSLPHAPVPLLRRLRGPRRRLDERAPRARASPARAPHPPRPGQAGDEPARPGEDPPPPVRLHPPPPGPLHPNPRAPPHGRRLAGPG